jgi:hypothetical protein
MDAKRAPQPDWPTVRYMTASIQYAGRITDDYDRLLMVRRRGDACLCAAALLWRRVSPYCMLKLQRVLACLPAALIWRLPPRLHSSLLPPCRRRMLSASTIRRR